MFTGSAFTTVSINSAASDDELAAFTVATSVATFTQQRQRSWQRRNVGVPLRRVTDESMIYGVTIIDDHTDQRLRQQL